MIEIFEIMKQESPTGFYVRHDEDEKYRLFYGTHLVSTFAVNPLDYLSDSDPEKNLLEIIIKSVLSGIYDRLIFLKGW